MSQHQLHEMEIEEQQKNRSLLMMTIATFTPGIFSSASQFHSFIHIVSRLLSNLRFHLYKNIVTYLLRGQSRC